MKGVKYGFSIGRSGARQVESFLTYKIRSPRHRVESELTYKWRRPSPTKPAWVGNSMCGLLALGEGRCAPAAIRRLFCVTPS